MSLGLYFDQHAPAPIRNGLRARGVDVLTTQEDGTEEVADEDLLLRALELDRLIFTQDDDFLAIAHEWLDTGREFAGVAYLHQRRTVIREAIESLELLAMALDPEGARNQIFYLPL